MKTAPADEMAATLEQLQQQRRELRATVLRLNRASMIALNAEALAAALIDQLQELAVLNAPAPRHRTRQDEREADQGTEGAPRRAARS